MKQNLICLALAASLGLLLPAISFCAAAPIPPAAPAAVEVKVVDINTATLEDLQTVSGIGVSLARRIIEYREKNGPFKAVDDLLAIVGIGPKSLEGMRAQIKVAPLK